MAEYKNLLMFSKDPALHHFITETLPLAKEAGVPSKVIESLEKGLHLSWLRLKFEEDNTTPGGDVCNNILKETNARDWRKAFEEGTTKWECEGGMISSNVVCQFLKSIVSATKAKNVLEVGMFTGYTAIAMAEALPDDGKLVTIDQDEYFKNLVTSFLEGSPHKNKVDIRVGKALEIMKKMSENGESYDIIFLDADKSEYPAYLEMCLEKNVLSKNGTIIADNAFWDGLGYTDSTSTAAVFADALDKYPSLHKVLVPIKDGIYLIRRRDEVDGGTL